MDAGPIIATPPPVVSAADSAAPDANGEDAAAFAAHLPPEDAPLKPLRKVAARIDAEPEPVAPTTTYALSTPMAPVALRLDATPGLLDVSFTPTPASTAPAVPVVGAPGAPALAAPKIPAEAIAPAGDAATPDAKSPAAQTTTPPAPANDSRPPLAALPQTSTPSTALAGDIAATLAAPKPVTPTPQAEPRRLRDGSIESATPTEPLRSSTTQQPVAAVAQAAARAGNREGAPSPAAPAAKDDAAAPALAESAPAQTHEGRRLQESAAATPVHRPPTPAATVAQHVIRRFEGQSTTIEVRLDPAELGRVHVKLDVGADARVTATVAADNPATLSDLMRSARDLERALESAGLELASGGLSFDLSDRRTPADAEAHADGGGALRGTSDESDVAATAPPSRPFGLESWRGVRVDVTV
jgi:hypothetical protein